MLFSALFYCGVFEGNSGNFKMRTLPSGTLYLTLDFKNLPRSVDRRKCYQLKAKSRLYIEQKCADTIGTVLVSGLAISNAKI